MIAVTCAYVFQAIAKNWDQVAALDIRFHFAYVPALLLGVLYIVVRGFIWHLMLARLVGPLPLALNVGVWLAAQLGKYLPGKVLVLVGRVMIYRERGVSVARVTVGFALELLLVFATTALLTFVAWRLDERLVPDLIGLGAAPAFVLLMVACHPQWLRVLGLLLKRFRSLDLEVANYRFRDALHWMCWMVFDWLLLGLGVFLISDAVVPLNFDLFIPICAAFALAGTAGIAALVVPAGLGVREGVLTALLAPIVGVGPAAVVAIFTRLWMTLAEVLSALIAVPLLRRAGRAGAALPGSP